MGKVERQGHGGDCPDTSELQGGMPVLRGVVRGDEGLAQGEPAVAARHFGVGENVQTFGFEPALQVFKQKNILEGTAAQTNILKAGLPVDEFCCPCQHIHKPLMEAAADDARRHGAIQVVHDGRKQRTGIDYPAAPLWSNLKRVAGDITLARDGRLEFDGRLGLVIEIGRASCRERVSIDV